MLRKFVTIFCMLSLLKTHCPLSLHTLITVYRVGVCCCWTHI